MADESTVLTEHDDEDELRQAIVSLRRRIRAGDEPLARQLCEAARSHVLDIHYRCRAIDAIAGAQAPAFSQTVFDLLKDLSVDADEYVAIHSIGSAGYLPRDLRQQFKRAIQSRNVGSPRVREVIAAFAREN